MAWESNLLPLRLPARRQANEVESRNMQVFLIGVACVGKTTIGANLADLLVISFSIWIMKSKLSSERRSSVFRISI